MQEKRLFVALPLPPQVTAKLSEVPKALQQEGLRWVPAANWHLTVLFLGGVTEEEAEGCISRLQQAPMPGPFTLRLKPAVRVVDRRGRTEMIWAAFESSLPFAQLCFRVADTLSRTPDREPLPHVTLARTRKDFRRRISAGLFPALEPLQFEVNGFELWESKLSPKGAEYQSLAQFQLGKGS
jgi:2'-5' RNA ligase